MKKALDVNWVARELGAAEKILFMPGNGGIVLKKEDNGWSVQLEQPWMVGRAICCMLRMPTACKPGSPSASFEESQEPLLFLIVCALHGFAQ